MYGVAKSLESRQPHGSPYASGVDCRCLQGVQVCLSSAFICCYCPDGHYSVLRKHCHHVFCGLERSACPEAWCLCALVDASPRGGGTVAPHVPQPRPPPPPPCRLTPA